MRRFAPRSSLVRAVVARRAARVVTGVCAVALLCVGCKPAVNDAAGTSSLATIAPAITTTSTAAGAVAAAAATTTVVATSALAVGGYAEKVFAQSVPGYQTLDAPTSVVNEFLSSLQSEAQAGDVLDSVAARLLQSTDAGAPGAAANTGTIVF